ncbi:MAG: DUF2264 domain-containing protein [Tessaracoccus sp.]|uniref:DUF2264 domain-containing protein n=1 Tax=Tessaracoccus sp. TaxID=1971211 RepID=UPI001EC041A1|nr:DUF2264 domain-containing protein [Tessaracoccus sp.]MBK7819974.1 DUF2264 domain-containing protein [Tessaracoccus sp.]
MELAHDAYGRDWWTRLADDLLAALRPYASANNARITPPGAEGGYGRDVDGLEGFARSLMIAGFRIAGERGEGVDDLIEFYASGIAAGVDPAAPDRWVRPSEHAQAKVESASIALVLDLTRPWIWDRFSDTTKQQVIGYLGELVGDDTFPRNNWLWFRIVVETFLRSVGGPWSADDIAADLALHESFLRPDGWIADGDSQAFDQYTGWALHLYPALWPRMSGAAELMGDRAPADTARLDRFLLDARQLIGSDGSPLIQGRSLIYRFAAAAPFWAGVLSEVPATSLGALRVAAGRIVEHFVDRGAPNVAGLLDMGWHHEWRQLAQSYSGPGSPYWAAKGLIGVMLPADHPVWTAPAEPLPIDEGDILAAIAAPGWVAHGTSADGIVRVVNHGTDHAMPGTLVGDSPLYARIGYSTATSPLLDDDAWVRPLEQSVAVVDVVGRATHRAALRLLGARVEGEVGVAGSTSTAHWITPGPERVNHGSGLEGETEPAGALTVWSLVRGPWELRLASLDDLPEGLDPETLRLRFGGWPLAADARDAIAGENPLSTRGLTSRLTAVVGRAETTSYTHHEASPLGAVSVTPTLTFGVRAGEWVGAVVELSGRPVGDDESTVTLTEDGDVLIAEVTWPDGQATTTHLIGTRGATDAPEADRDLI